MDQRYSRIDPRQVTKFLKDPEFTQSISPGARVSLDKRVLQAKWQPNERIVYDAVQDGYTSMDSLPVATGLSEADVRAAVAGLIVRGAVSEVTVEGY